jgi:hypothetical protein
MVVQHSLSPLKLLLLTMEISSVEHEVVGEMSETHVGDAVEEMDEVMEEMDEQLSQRILRLL